MSTNSNISETPLTAPLTIARSNRAKHLRITVKPDQTIRLTIPNGVSIETAIHFLHSKISWITKHQHRLSKLENAQKKLPVSTIDDLEARDIIVGRLETLAKTHNFNYAKVSIRNQKTKWGSCSPKNNISLNINLAKLPEELRDYVIIHELVHTSIKNHGKKFWAELDKFVGGSAKKLSKKLRKYRLPAQD